MGWGGGGEAWVLCLLVKVKCRPRERPLPENDFWQHGQKLHENGELFLFSLWVL